MNKKELELQQKGAELVSRHILHNLSLTAEKELKENPELLDEAKNYDYGESEIYEFWAVDEWLANKLENKGEIIFKMLDFIVWGRQTTGQAIKMDNVIQEIAEETF